MLPPRLLCLSALGTSFALAALLLSEGLKDEAYHTAWCIHHVIYETKGYWFRTPEAWNDDLSCGGEGGIIMTRFSQLRLFLSLHSQYLHFLSLKAESQQSYPSQQCPPVSPMDIE